MRLRFEDILNTLTPSTKENIEQREQLLKIKRGISKAEIKELRQILAWTSNEIHRRRDKRKSTKKEREIFQKLKEWANQQLNRNEDLIYVKEKAWEELRYRNIKVKRIKIKDAGIRNNRMFQEDQGMFYRKTLGMKQLKGKVPKIEKFEEFWAGIWEDDTKTPQRKWMNTIARKITEKVTNVQELVITEEIFYGTVKKWKDWSAPGIDEIPNFYWKKLRGT